MKNVTKKHVEMLDARVKELVAKIAEVSVDESIAKTTRGTKLYHLKHELKTLRLVNELLSDADKLSKDALEHLNGLIKPADERQQKFYVEEGEQLLSIMQRYPNKKNLITAISEYCGEHGLKLDAAAMKIVKA